MLIVQRLLQLNSDKVIMCRLMNITVFYLVVVTILKPVTPWYHQLTIDLVIYILY